MGLVDVVWHCKHSKPTDRDLLLSSVDIDTARKYVKDNTTKATLTNGVLVITRSK